MPGLTIKVFRTYNASITLSDLLKKTDGSLEVAGKKAEYDEANKEVAILCNHQKGVSKNHDTAMAKLVDKKKALQEELRGASAGAAAKLRYGRQCCVWSGVIPCLIPVCPHLPQGAHRDVRPGHAVQGVAEDGVAGHQQDQLPGPAHHGGLVQDARGAHREDLHQGPAGQIQRPCAGEPSLCVCCARSPVCANSHRSGPWRRSPPSLSEGRNTHATMHMEDDTQASHNQLLRSASRRDCRSPSRPSPVAIGSAVRATGACTALFSFAIGASTSCEPSVQPISSST